MVGIVRLGNSIAELVELVAIHEIPLGVVVVASNVAVVVARVQDVAIACPFGRQDAS